jgi:hypothetical protein
MFQMYREKRAKRGMEDMEGEGEEEKEKNFETLRTGKNIDP